MTFKCEDLCDNCRTNFLKDPDKLGDYEGGVLLRYCPVCGQMLPFLRLGRNDEEDESISNSLKRRVGTKVAKTYKLDYVAVNDIIKELKKIHYRETFIDKFEKSIKKVFDIEISLKSFM